MFRVIGDSPDKMEPLADREPPDVKEKRDPVLREMPVHLDAMDGLDRRETPDHMVKKEIQVILISKFDKCINTTDL